MRKARCACACGGANHGKKTFGIDRAVGKSATVGTSLVPALPSPFTPEGAARVNFASIELEFQYPGLQGFPSQCRLFITREPGRTPVVILTELDDNPGTSITNAAETIATLVYRDFLAAKVGPMDVRWVEHYPGISGKTETYDAVTFGAYDNIRGYSSPRWARLKRHEIYETEPLKKEPENENRTIQTNA